MCGIAGYFSQQPRADGACIATMTTAIARRGPDDEGYALIDGASGAMLQAGGRDTDAALAAGLAPIAATGFGHHIAFGQRRFSIVELSPEGHQPMVSADGEICLIFNGEIYNYVELRERLEALGRRFRSRSDTEVLIAGYLEWGTEVFALLNGPYAIALYDRRRRGLLLARDKLGKAPLYYTRRDGMLLWASEIKALFAAGGLRRDDIDVATAGEFVHLGWRDRGRTLWRGIEDFPPAHWAWVEPSGQMTPQRYWAIPGERLSADEIGLDEACAGLSELLADAVRLRLRADVPAAMELSGGMDSSSLVALAARQSRVVTYTVKFDEAEADEEAYAAQVARRYGERVDYRVIRPAQEDFWAVADDFVRIEEEPFHSPNLATNQGLRRVMREQGYRVVISGSAGDEVLAGYPFEYFPPYLAGLLGRGRLGKLWREAAMWSEGGTARALPELARYLAARLAYALQPGRRSRSSALLADICAPAMTPARCGDLHDFAGLYLNNLQARKMNYWLRSANKANFALPIEARAPFLDHRVVEYAARLPAEYLIRDGWHKYALRHAMRDLLPDEVLWRRVKMGFPFPLKSWLLASQETVRRNLQDLDCPHVDFRRLLAAYPRLAEAQPSLAWRAVSFGLWWRRVVLDQALLR
jgi:asparagine synthase (glutamine-hydrolysing)